MRTVRLKTSYLTLMNKPYFVLRPKLFYLQSFMSLGFLKEECKSFLKKVAPPKLRHLCHTIEAFCKARTECSVYDLISMCYSTTSVQIVAESIWRRRAMTIDHKKNLFSKYLIYLFEGSTVLTDHFWKLGWQGVTIMNCGTNIKKRKMKKHWRWHDAEIGLSPNQS